MKSIYFPAFIAGLLLLCSCHNANQKDVKSVSSQSAMTLEPIENKEDKIDGEFTTDTTRAVQQTNPKRENAPSAESPAPDWDKKIIKNASLNAEVSDYHAFYSLLRGKVKALGGYVAQEEQHESPYKIENEVVIKIPVDQFDEAVAQLSAGIKTINEKKITSQNVTTEIIDTKSRIEAKKQVRLRYMDLLKEAKTMQDILSVQSEINDVQEQIESATGRVGYMSHESAFSTINITYYQVLDAKAGEEKTASVSERIGHAFAAGWSWIRELLIGLISVWPLFLVAVMIYIFYKKSKTRIREVKEVK